MGKPGLTDLYIYEGQYETDRSSTQDVVVLAPNGILSVKIVTSSGGRKTLMFAGFSEFFYANGSPPDEHKYVKAQLKAVEKWMGTASEMTVDNPEAILSKWEIDLDMVDGRVGECFEQAFGYKPTRPSVGQQRAQELQRWALAPQAAEGRLADQLANDATFGMF